MSKAFDILLPLFFHRKCIYQENYNFFLMCLHMITDSTTAI